ncbi:MAG TPA: STAS domain-containing protein [Pseudonocardia sp.]
MSDNVAATRNVLSSYVSVEHDDVEGLMRIRIFGELDLSTVDTTATALTELVRCSDSDVLVDLAETGFVAVAGVRVLAAMADGCRAEGRSFALAGVSGVLRRMLTVCQLEHLIAFA